MSVFSAPGALAALQKRRGRALPAFDLPFLAILLALLSFGLLMLYSARRRLHLYPAAIAFCSARCCGDVYGLPY